MKEYIEREAAIETIRSLYPSVPLVKLNIEKWHEKNKAYMECETAIERIPAADVRPVVRGQWELDSDPGEPWRYVCNICGEKTKDTVMGKPRANFCPNCGAVMEES